MMIPVHVPSSGQQEDHSTELITAMRLLSGKDCKRDASQAQVLLVRLSESRQKDIALDAEDILKASLSKNWFDDVVPRFSELERIAEVSLSKKNSNPDQRRILTLGVGMFILLIGGVLVFKSASGSGGEGPPWIMIALLATLILAGYGVFMNRN